MRGAWRIALAELSVLLAAACQDARPHQAPAPLRSTHGSPASLKPLLAPRPSSRFACEGHVCRQRYPRLPSSAEWRCAERAGSVWCAGGEPAAGAVASSEDAAFRCGRRWGDHGRERVCIDFEPEYPDDAGARRCSFEQEQGIVRVCKSDDAEGHVAPRLPATVVAACWLDRDCGSGRCDRGACNCRTNADCERGQCRAGYCSEAKP